MAPEMVQNKVHDEKIDIWSLGVLLYELIHGYPPFRGKSTDQKFNEILNNNFSISESCSAECKDIIRKLLRPNPKERADFEEIFIHPFIMKFEGEFGIKVSSYVYNPSKKKKSKRSLKPREQSQQEQAPQSTTQIFNDTMNNSSISNLDVSAVNFEPLSMKKVW